MNSQMHYHAFASAARLRERAYSPSTRSGCSRRLLLCSAQRGHGRTTRASRQPEGGGRGLCVCVRGGSLKIKFAIDSNVNISSHILYLRPANSVGA